MFWEREDDGKMNRTRNRPLPAGRLAPAEARELAVETTAGAARMIQETGEDSAVLRARVSSPGGTTLAGLEALEAGGFAELISEAVGAATLRSRELSAAATRPRKS